MWKSPQQIEVEAQARLEWLQHLRSQTRPHVLTEQPGSSLRQRFAKVLRTWADYVDAPTQRSLQ
jgi:hypothetical protein